MGWLKFNINGTILPGLRSLENLGNHDVVAHPSKTRMIADAKVKTYKHDAKTLGESDRDFLMRATQGRNEVQSIIDAISPKRSP
jgi:hypothetical protein